MTPEPATLEPPLLDRLTRPWNEWLATVADPLWGGVFTLMLITLLAAILFGVLWAYWPAWLPTRWRRIGLWGRREDREKPERPHRRRLRLRWRWRWRWRRRRRADPDVEVTSLPEAEVPDLPAEVLTLSADELARAGRLAEAVRERLRAMLRGLIERGLAPASPGWTVAELARAAGRGRAELAEPLQAAVGIFSEIWYGLRPATVEDDEAMRALAATVVAVADAVREPTSVPAGRPG